MGLGPLPERSRVKRAVISTYQACPAPGPRTSRACANEPEAVLKIEKVTDLNGFPNPIAFNVLITTGPSEEATSNEEWKVIKETHKILGDDSIHVAVTTVQVPAYVSHGESVWIQTEKPIPPAAAREVFAKAPRSGLSTKSRRWTAWRMADPGGRRAG